MEFRWSGTKLLRDLRVDFNCAGNNAVLESLHVLGKVPSLHEAPKNIPEDEGEEPLRSLGQAEHVEVG